MNTLLEEYKKKQIKISITFASNSSFVEGFIHFFDELGIAISPNSFSSDMYPLYDDEDIKIDKCIHLIPWSQIREITLCN